MKLASDRFPRDQQNSPDGGHILGHAYGDPPLAETPYTIDSIGHLAFRIMAELSACLQMITSDIAHAADLGEASMRWLQRLMALSALIERAHSIYPVGHTGPHGEHRSPLAGHAGVRPPQLTAREREIMALTRKGYPPRKIAQRLHVSVETVYTHLRNARRKQRILGS